MLFDLTVSLGPKMEDLPPIRGHGENDDQPLGWFGTIFFFQTTEGKNIVGCFALRCVDCVFLCLRK